MMGSKIVKKIDRRNFRQLSAFLLAGLFSACLFAGYSSTTVTTLKKSEPRIAGRAPASAFGEEQYDLAPVAQTIWLQKVFVADQAGVMDRVRGTYDYWEAQEEYARNWNLESTGLFEISTQDERKKYFNRNILKYVDKRISGEIRNAEEGSTFHTVGQVQEALKPNAEVGLTENYKLKFRARILEGRGTMVLVNPFCDASMVLRLNGELNVIAKKKFDNTDIEAGVDISVDEGRWLAHVDHKLTDNIIARASSEQKMDLSRDTDTKLEVYFHKSF